MTQVLLPLGEYWWLCLAVIFFVCFLLGVDLCSVSKSNTTHTLKGPIYWTIFWILTAICFNIILYFYALHVFSHDPRYTSILGFDAAGQAKRIALEFLGGYVVEKALSVDNLFVFSVIFSYFAVPSKAQHRVLFLGILGAIVFRGTFILLGMTLIQFEIIPILFGLLLIWTGIKVFHSDDSGPDIEDNFALKALKRYFPITRHYHGSRLTVREGGKLLLTPLLVTMVVIEVSDIMFAIDSVPAVIALSHEPIVVFTSNLFAILGLRSLYFVLAGCQERFHLLRYGLGFVLMFVGAKMTFLNSLFGGHFPITLSLFIILSSISVTIFLSLYIPKEKH